MSIQFVIGRAGSGKSTYCLEQIRERLLERPEGHPLILLVPEQASFQAEYALVSTPGLSGTMRAQVLSFRRLAWRVMQETGGTARVPISDSGKKMLLHKIIHNHSERLKHLSLLEGQMGSIEQLNQLFTEWKRYCVDSERLNDFVSKSADGRETKGGLSSTVLQDKLHDLKLIYSEFETEMSKAYIDGEDQLETLAKQLLHCPYTRDAEIWVDGFHGFTPQEFAVLEQMMLHSRSLMITVTLDREYSALEKPHELEIFHPTARTMALLQEMADDLLVAKKPTIVLEHSTLPRFRGSPALAELETVLSRRRNNRAASGYTVPTDGDGIMIREAANRRTEIEALAREMIRLVRDDGYRWRELAIMLRDAEAYNDLIANVFSAYEIPYFIDQKRTVMHHPLVEFIRSALEVVTQNWRYDSVFRCVKTEFLFPLYEDEDAYDNIVADRHAMDQLENYALAFGIRGSQWKTAKTWNYRQQVSLEQYRRMVSNPLARFEQKLGKACHVRDMVEALFYLLSDLNAAERLEQWSRRSIASGKPEKAREHTQVWDSVMDLFDQFVEMMGDERISPELFVKLLETGLESLRLGLVPPSLDQVLVGNIDRTRSGSMKCVFVVGVNDGVIPARLHEEGLLTEAERDVLLAAGLPMADGIVRKLLDEQFLIYTTLCMPGNRLWISYSLADEEGKSLLPSEIIRRLLRSFPGLKLQTIAAEPVYEMALHEQMSYAAHPRQALSYLTVQIKRWMAGEQIAPLWWDVYNWFVQQETWRFPLERMARSLFYRNIENPLSWDTSVELYGKEIAASVSRMELYAACPFSQFVSYGLKLQERRIYRLDAPDIGQLYHAALSGMAAQFREEKADWGAATMEQLQYRASRIVEQLSPQLQNDILLSSERYQFMAHKLKNVVGRAAFMLGEHARRSEFDPIGLELGFGSGESLPPLTISLNNGRTMEIRGRIDRVDQAEGKQMLLRVIDYKSSMTSLQLPRVYYGLSLQMLTYLDVLLTHAEQWLGRAALPAGVLYFQVHNPIIQSKNALTPEQVKVEMNKRFKTRGLLLSDADTVRMMDNELRDASGHSDLLPVGLKRDGTFYQTSSVATESQWKQLRGFVRSKIKRIGEGITEGDVSIAPYRMGQHIPCTYCSYRPVCQFDSLVEGNEYRIFSNINKEEVWRAIGSEAAEGGMNDER